MRTFNTSPPVAESPAGVDFVSSLTGFCRQLRLAGLTVGSGDVIDYCSAASAVDPTDLVDLYWAGRASLVTRHDQIEEYDRVFAAYFLGEPAEGEPGQPFSAAAREEALAELEVPLPPEPGTEREEQATKLGLVASGAATLRTRPFADCTPQELAQLRALMASMRLVPPRRTSRRSVRTRRGRHLDVRRMARESMRRHGDLTDLRWRTRRRRVRPLILVLDVSGSMADYSRALMQFAHSTRRAQQRVEVFCFGTRLTRITAELNHRRPDDALDRAATNVFDFEGGTRIGACLDALVRTWARRGVTRGGIVVICSDGLDRGDPQLLATAMERLARLSHRIVWMNPHKGDATDYQPTTLGMMVAAPHIDRVLSGHDLASLGELAEVLPELG